MAANLLFQLRNSYRVVSAHNNDVCVCSVCVVCVVCVLCVLCVFCVCCVCCVCMLACTCDCCEYSSGGCLVGRKVQPSRQLGSLTVGSALHCWISGYADVNPFISTIIWHILVLSLFPPSFCWYMKIKGRSLIVTCGSDAVI